MRYDFNFSLIRSSYVTLTPAFHYVDGRLETVPEIIGRELSFFPL